MTNGIDLARSYYRDIVAPLLEKRWVGLPHAGARLGSGSDVLGLDDETSQDHDWGLRMTLLVEAARVEEVSDYLEEALPDTYAGLPVRFATTWDRRIRQRAEVATAEAFVESRLGMDVAGDVSNLDWLCLTGQSLLEVTAGEVFFDSIGTLTSLRQKLAWYPDDAWLHVVATDWIRLGLDLPLLGRTAQRGDVLGSFILRGRIVNTLMHLAFLTSRQWVPYPKWAGTMFTRLPIYTDLSPLLGAAISSESWEASQDAIKTSIDVLYAYQKNAGLPSMLESPTESFFDRPFLGIHESVPNLLLDEISDPVLRALPRGVGSVEQWIDNARVLTNATARVATARAHLLGS